MLAVDDNPAQQVQAELHKGLVPIKDVIKALQWHRSTFYRHLARGDFTTVKIGRQAFVPIADFTRWREREQLKAEKALAAKRKAAARRAKQHEQ